MKYGNFKYPQFHFSAYTGGLWLAALRCTIKIAELLELKDSVMKYNGVLERGKRAFERKLWNGKDCSFCTADSVFLKKAQRFYSKYCFNAMQISFMMLVIENSLKSQSPYPTKKCPTKFLSTLICHQS